MSTFFFKFLFDRLTQYLGANTLSTGHEGQNQEARRLETGDSPPSRAPRLLLYWFWQIKLKSDEAFAYQTTSPEYWVNTIDQAWDSCIPLHVVVFKNPPPPNEWPFCVFNEFLWMPASQRQNYQHGRDKRPHENLKPKLCVDAKVTRSQPLLTTQRLKSLLPESYRIVDRFPGSKEIKCKVWTRSYP